jgi:transposase-like protein
MQIHCPWCQSDKRQNKAGFTRFGSQRYFCTACVKTYTPVPKERGYGKEIRQQAVAMRLEGTSQRKTARLLRVAVQSVGNWFQDAQQRLEQSGQEPLPQEARLACCVIEMDELHSFVGAKRGEKKK